MAFALPVHPHLRPQLLQGIWRFVSQLLKNVMTNIRAGRKGIDPYRFKTNPLSGGWAFRVGLLLPGIDLVRLSMDADRASAFMLVSVFLLHPAPPNFAIIGDFNFFN
jgi:hypothetical protein